jgi:hypothetical protein
MGMGPMSSSSSLGASGVLSGASSSRAASLTRARLRVSCASSAMGGGRWWRRAKQEQAARVHSGQVLIKKSIAHVFCICIPTLSPWPLPSLFPPTGR